MAAVAESEKNQVVFIVRLTAGGIRAHVLDLVANLSDRYSPLVVGALDDVFQDKLKAMGVEFVVTPIEDRVRPFRDLSTLLNLRKMLRRLRPGLVHIHGNKAALLGLTAARFAGRVPCVVTVHNYVSINKSGGFKAKIASMVQRRLYGWSTRVIAVSDDLREGLLADKRLPATKIVTIHNGIDVARWSACQEARARRSTSPAAGGGEFRLLAVGRFVEFKGHRYLLEAVSRLAAKYPGLRLDIAGDGPLREQLTAQRDESGLSGRVRFLGYVMNPGPLYSEADLLVMPSLWEGLPYTLLEVMACGCPVLATKAGGLPELVDDGKTGLLVPPGDSEALAAGIARFIDKPTLGPRLAAAALEAVKGKFSVHNMARATEDVYERCLGSSYSHNDKRV